MASKAFKRKQRVKEYKEHHKAPAGKKPSWIVPAVIILAVVVIGYFIFSGLLGPRYVPTADDDPSTGPADAKVTVIEFGCFSCPYTKKFNTEVLPQLMERYDGQVNFVFRSVPIYSKRGIALAHAASECADDQGKFWEYADLLFRGPSEFDKSLLNSFAESSGLDMDQFNECLDSGKYIAETKKDYADGKRAGVSTTPTLFINGFKVVGVHDINIYTNIIDDMLSN